mgnify:FL=1|nr:MAG TPA: hypothetical protein [Caudoviricetes sp.]
MFLTPHMRRIVERMQGIHEAAEARSDNPFFWDYTPAELAELAELHRAYMAEKSAAGL